MSAFVATLAGTVGSGCITSCRVSLLSVMGARMASNPRRANGHRRNQVRRRVLAEEDDCWLCGLPVDKTLKTPDPGSPEVDEVVPVSLGGDPLDRRNCRLSHMICNRKRGNGQAGAKSARRVLLICGPPGSGKTTLARSSGLKVYDLDDPEWGGSERKFREALAVLRIDPGAQAAVIRSGATVSARRKAGALCGATETVLLDVDEATCVERVISRKRSRPPLPMQIAAVKKWWERYEPHEPLPVVAVKRVRQW